MKIERQTQFNLWYFLIAIFAVFWLQGLWVQYRTVEPISYSEFINLAKEGKIEEITVRQNTIEGRFKAPQEGGRSRFVAIRVDPDLARDLEQYNLKFSGVIESNFLYDILGWVVPALVFFALWFYLMRRFAEKSGMGGGFLSIGKSKVKVYMEQEVKVSFADVAGVDEAKDELKEVVDFLRNPKEYSRLGARIPKGVLLVGPPGTGKTLLARAVAGEAAVPFLSINGSEFVEMFVGVGAARVRDLFLQAREKAPAIIFIDELDALGRARGAYVGGHDEKEQTLNQLLVEMDGFDPSTGLVLLAATNRPEILDPALLRAGRFDRQVLVDRPDKKGRIEILNVHLKKVTLAPDVDPEKIAALTPGFTGADLANLVNEAALLATRRRGSDAVTLEDFNNAVERIVAGLEKRNRILNEKERRVVAYHEMGHALVALTLPGSDPVHKISIIPRGVGALGYTIQRPTEDRFLMTTDELENKMAVLLGGRAAERVVFNEISTGAADDLQRVTNIARSMVMRFGMVEKLGQVAYEGDDGNRFLNQTPAGINYKPREFSEDTAREIDDAVKALIDRAFAKSVKVLTDRRAVLERGAQLLLQKETLTESEIEALVATHEQQPEALVS
jgi:cell division protease FtsH